MLKNKLYYSVEVESFDCESMLSVKYSIHVIIETNLRYIEHDVLLNIIYASKIFKDSYDSVSNNIENITQLTLEEFINLLEKFKRENTVLKYYIKKKLYYVNEQLLDSIGDYLSVSEYKNLRVYEIIDGEFKEFYNTEYSYDESCLEVLKEYLNEISYNKELDEYTFDENDYEFIEL